MLRTLPVAALALMFSTASMAQVSVGGSPYGIRVGLSLRDIPTAYSAPFDAQTAATEDSIGAAAHRLPMYGRVLAVEAGLDDAGQWTEGPNGMRIWRLRVASNGALATELFFSGMHLPEGASLYVYNEAGTEVLGGFTDYNNTASGEFATAQMMGPSSIVEYDEPAEVQGQGRLLIASVGHAYRQVGDAQADACEVDVNCPEGDDWHDQRDGVVRVGVKVGAELGWCSGSLVNNLAQDCKPYFLTANHCNLNSSDGEATATDFELWKFYFKYQRPACASGTAFVGSVLTGCVKRGDSHDNGGDSGSDFILLEANDATIPTSFDPYWMGWDATGSGSTGGVGIHHPAGSEKKISTYTVTTLSSTWGTVPDTHWRITWAATTDGHGVTEGGSSGSPMLNAAHRIIGTLTGGTSCCTSSTCGQGTGPNQPDWYGKVSYDWQNNFGTTNEKLKHWLDPASTGILSMDGSYSPCGPQGINEENATVQGPFVYPNPASGHVTLLLPGGMRARQIEVLDVTGRILLREMSNADGKADIDVSPWASGTYVVRVVMSGGRYKAARLNVVRP